MQRLFALRGANSVERNEASAILAATDELMREMITRNGLTPETMVSCIFTLTAGPRRRVPGGRCARARAEPRAAAVHARGAGAGSLPRVVRTLLHYYADEEHVPKHVYLNEASVLRSDLDSAQ